MKAQSVKSETFRELGILSQNTSAALNDLAETIGSLTTKLKLNHLPFKKTLEETKKRLRRLDTMIEYDQANRFQKTLIEHREMLRRRQEEKDPFLLAPSWLVDRAECEYGRLEP